MRIGIASDHAGFELKKELLAYLAESHDHVVDFGAPLFDAGDDFPDYVVPLAKSVLKREIDRGIAICGSGVGACVAANKVRHVRAAIVHDLFSAQQGVEDDDMNVICIAANLTDSTLAKELVGRFLKSKFSEKPRFKRRLEKIDRLEEMVFKDESDSLTKPVGQSWQF